MLPSRLTALYLHVILNGCSFIYIAWKLGGGGVSLLAFLLVHFFDQEMPQFVFCLSMFFESMS